MSSEQQNSGPRPIQPRPDNMVCSWCGCAEVECLEWVRVNDNYVIGGNKTTLDDEHWCPGCEIHKNPVPAKDYCYSRGHRGKPCTICGAV